MYPRNMFSSRQGCRCFIPDLRTLVRTQARGPRARGQRSTYGAGAPRKDWRAIQRRVSQARTGSS